MLKNKFLTIQDKSANLYVFGDLLCENTLATTGCTCTFDEGTKTLAGVASLFLVEERVLTDAGTFASVTGGTLSVGAFRLSRAIAACAQHIPRVGQGHRLLVEERTLQINFDRLIGRQAIKVEVVPLILVCTLFTRLAGLSLIRPFSPLIEKILINEIVVVHESLLASLAFPSLNFFLVDLLVVPIHIGADTCEVIVVLFTGFIVDQSLIGES